MADEESTIAALHLLMGDLNDRDKVELVRKAFPGLFVPYSASVDVRRLLKAAEIAAEYAATEANDDPPWGKLKVERVNEAVVSVTRRIATAKRYFGE